MHLNNTGATGSYTPEQHRWVIYTWTTQVQQSHIHLNNTGESYTPEQYRWVIYTWTTQVQQSHIHLNNTGESYTPEQHRCNNSNLHAQFQRKHAALYRLHVNTNFWCSVRNFTVWSVLKTDRIWENAGDLELKSRNGTRVTTFPKAAAVSYTHLTLPTNREV